MPLEPGTVAKISKARKWLWGVSMNTSVILAVGAILSSPAWVGGFIKQHQQIDDNAAAIVTNGAAIQSLVETVGDMGLLFGNAEIMEVGAGLTASINLHSDAVRFKQGQRLEITNTGDRRQMTTTVTVDGKFESEPFTLLNLSNQAGRAVGAGSGDRIQVMVKTID